MNLIEHSIVRKWPEGSPKVHRKCLNHAHAQSFDRCENCGYWPEPHCAGTQPPVMNSSHCHIKASHMNSLTASPRHIKVAEHSFRKRSCWCDSARAQGLQKQTCRSDSDHFVCSMPALSLLFFFVIESSVMKALVFSNKSVLEKVTVRRTQQFSDFSISKEPS